MEWLWEPDAEVRGEVPGCVADAVGRIAVVVGPDWGKGVFLFLDQYW